MNFDPYSVLQVFWIVAPLVGMFALFFRISRRGAGATALGIIALLLQAATSGVRWSVLRVAAYPSDALVWTANIAEMLSFVLLLIAFAIAGKSPNGTTPFPPYGQQWNPVPDYATQAPYANHVVGYPTQPHGYPTQPGPVPAPPQQW